MRPLLAVIAFVGMAAVLPPGVLPPAGMHNGPADHAAIRLVWSTVDATWNARDAERFSQLFTVDGRFEFVDRRQSLEPRTAIRRSFEARFPTFAPELRHLTRIQEILDLAPGVCTVDGTVHILQRPPGEEGPDTAVLRTFAIFAVMLRGEDGWRIRTLRAYELPAAPAGAPPPPPHPLTAPPGGAGAR